MILTLRVEQLKQLSCRPTKEGKPRVHSTEKGNFPLLDELEYLRLWRRYIRYLR